MTAGQAMHSPSLLDALPFPACPCLLGEPPAPGDDLCRLHGALAGLAAIDPAQLPRFKRAVAAGRQLGWGYFFPGLLALNRPDRSAILVGEDDGSVCVFRWARRESRERLDVLLAPAPMSRALLRRCLERANDFNGDRSARVLRVDAADAGAVAATAGLQVHEHKRQFLFSPSAYADISGRKFRTIRRNVAKVMELPGIEVHPLQPAHLDDCRDLLARWGEHHRSVHGTRGGLGASRRALELVTRVGAPDLEGEVVLVQGRLVAYALWGEIRAGVAAFFDAKCEREPAGLAFFHRYHFLSRQRQFEVINDGSDADRPGLRQLKNSLRPIGFHVEHRAYQIAGP
ncbi:MAG: phosphatidylglycerol lysyltransferase domain-containing protein [Gammaproteobacteria bacterium]|nr:MAG: phosphatidylglycerol lysyltransferase domain-containing protein [Gammaproteobacteria bacterium]